MPPPPLCGLCAASRRTCAPSRDCAGFCAGMYLRARSTVIRIRRESSKPRGPMLASLRARRSARAWPRDDGAVKSGRPYPVAGGALTSPSRSLGVSGWCDRGGHAGLDGMKTAWDQTGGTSHVQRIFGGCVHGPRPHRRGLFGAQQREGQRPFCQWQRIGLGQRTQRKRKRERQQVAVSRSSSRRGNTLRSDHAVWLIWDGRRYSIV